MAYTPPVPIPTYKVGDIFTDELIAKINEILLDSKSVLVGKQIRSVFDIDIIENQSDKIYKFRFSFDFRELPGNTYNNIKEVFYYKSFEEYDFGDGTPTFTIPVDDNFQINADANIEMLQDDNQ